jgi:hypothetical protein
MNSSSLLALLASATKSSTIKPQAVKPASTVTLPEVTQTKREHFVLLINALAAIGATTLPTKPSKTDGKVVVDTDSISDTDCIQFFLTQAEQYAACVAVLEQTYTQVESFSEQSTEHKELVKGRLHEARSLRREAKAKRERLPLDKFRTAMVRMVKAARSLAADVKDAENTLTPFVSVGEQAEPKAAPTKPAKHSRK